VIVDEMVVDNFAGGGGASTGIEQALGRHADVAINHDPEAIAMHRANHPKTLHLTTDVFSVDPLEVTRGRPVGLGWFSPDCTHFSKAKGGKPRDKNIRGLAWVVVDWARAVRPRVIMLENVEEFRTWGPLDDDGYPIPDRKGETFAEWLAELRGLGYEVQFRELRASDYGAPTIRKRLFIVARCDGQEIHWPKPTHGKGGFAFLPLRTAAECIDWSLDCPSIFERRKPLAAATLRRIATGIKRYVIEAEQPFIVSLTHQGGDGRSYGVEQPFSTITSAHRGEQALVTPYVVRQNHDGQSKPADSLADPLGTVTTQHNKHALVAPYLMRTAYKQANGSYVNSVEEPMRTITAQLDGASLVVPTLVQTGYGEREGQAPRALDLEKPLGTIVGGGAKHALVTSFLAKHFGGHETPGSSLDEALSTVTAKDHHALVSSHLLKLYGTAQAGAPLSEPMPTVTSTGQHIAEVRAFLMHYYSGGGQTQGVDTPMHVITSKDRVALGIVHIAGEPYQIVDIGMRMLTPRELYRAQGFPDQYVIDPLVNGKPLTKTAQIRMCGNSVCPPAARAIVEANFGKASEHAWSGIEAAGG